MIMGVIGVCFLGEQKILAQIYSVDRQVAIFQIAVLECEAVFPSLCPALVVEVNIRSLNKHFKTAALEIQQDGKFKKGQNR